VTIVVVVPAVAEFLYCSQKEWSEFGCFSLWALQLRYTPYISSSRRLDSLSGLLAMHYRVFRNGVAGVLEGDHGRVRRALAGVAETRRHRGFPGPGATGVGRFRTNVSWLSLPAGLSCAQRSKASPMWTKRGRAKTHGQQGYSICSSAAGRPAGVRSNSVHSGSTVPRCRGSWP
jgi:hypothetical protein